MTRDFDSRIAGSNPAATATAHRLDRGWPIAQIPATVYKAKADYLLSWAGFQSPLPRYNETVAVEEVVECTDSLATVDTVVVEAVPAE